jgi:hypothetical protein
MPLVMTNLSFSFKIGEVKEYNTSFVQISIPMSKFGCLTYVQGSYEKAEFIILFASRE